jgi:hypothetical protein
MTRPATPAGANGLDARTWHTLTVAPNLSATHRACLSAAYAHADLTHHLLGRAPGAARDGLWYRLAVGFYESLLATGAFRHRTGQALPSFCDADPDAVRRWLTAPSPLPGFTDLSVAQTWGIADDFDWDDPDRDTILPTLITQAQAAGVLATPGHRIDLAVLAPDADAITAYRVLLHSPTGATFASAPLAADELAEDGLTGVDAAVAVVANTARTVRELLGHQRAVAYGPHAAVADAAPLRRAFAPLDLTTPTSVTANPAAATATPTHPRTR